MSVLDRIYRIPFDRPSLNVAILAVASVSIGGCLDKASWETPDTWTPPRWTIGRPQRLLPPWRQVATWLPLDAPPPGQLFHGVDRSVDASRLAGVRLPGGGDDPREQIVQASLWLGRLGRPYSPLVAVVPWSYGPTPIATPIGDVEIEVADVPRGFLIAPSAWLLFEWEGAGDVYACRRPEFNATFALNPEASCV